MLQVLKTGRVVLNGMSFHDIWFFKLTSQSSLCSGATPVAEPALRCAELGTGKGRAHSLEQTSLSLLRVRINTWKVCVGVAWNACSSHPQVQVSP